VNVGNASLGEKPFKITLRQVWSVHADGELPNVDEGPDPGALKLRQDDFRFSATVAQRKKISGFLGSRCVPTHPALKLRLYRHRGQRKPIRLWHSGSVPLRHFPVDDSV
jgi:hypothetical protein